MKATLTRGIQAVKKTGRIRLFSRVRDMMMARSIIMSPDGEAFWYKGRWNMVPRGAAVNMLQGNSYFYENFLSATGTNDTFFGKAAYVVAGGATFTALGINGGAGRATLAGDDGDVVAVYGPLAYEPDEAGRIWMQVRIRISDVSVASAFIGFTDAITDSVIIEDEDGTLNTVATDAFGILLEGEQDGTWQTMGVGNNVDDTQRASSNITDPVDATFTTVYIEADSLGNAARTVVRYRVRVDGVILATAGTDGDGWVNSVARSNIIYAPAVSVDDRGTTYTTDIAEMAANGGVGTTLD